MEQAEVPAGDVIWNCPIAKWILLTSPHPTLPFVTGQAFELRPDDVNLVESIDGVGGTSIFGGKGSVIGTAVASIVIGMMQYGLQMANITSQQTDVVIGSMLIVAVLLRSANWGKVSKYLSIISKNNAMTGMKK